jgi:hypothetical protein
MERFHAFVNEHTGGAPAMNVDQQAGRCRDESLEAKTQALHDQDFSP